MVVLTIGTAFMLLVSTSYMKVQKSIGNLDHLASEWLRREEDKRVRTAKQPLTDNSDGVTPTFILLP